MRTQRLGYQSKEQSPLPNKVLAFDPSVEQPLDRLRSADDGEIFFWGNKVQFRCQKEAFRRNCTSRKEGSKEKLNLSLTLHSNTKTQRIDPIQLMPSTCGTVLANKS